MMIGIDDSYENGIVEGLNRYIAEAAKRKDAVMYFIETPKGVFTPRIALSLSEAKPTTKLSERYVVPFDYNNVTKKLIIFAGENLKETPDDKMSKLFDCIEEYSGEECRSAMKQVGLDAIQDAIRSFEAEEFLDIAKYTIANRAREDGISMNIYIPGIEIKETKEDIELDEEDDYEIE